MNSLQAKYESRGLSIVGVTDEKEKETEAWVRQHGARYAYAYDPTGWLGKYFNVRSIPHAVLVDPNGLVVWAGHPNRLDERLLQKTLAGAVAEPISGWPKNTMKLQLLLKQGRYHQALSAAISLGRTYETFVRERIEAKVQAVQQTHADGNYLGALRLGEVVVKELTGLREALTVKTLVDSMRRSPEIQRVIKGQEEFSRIAQDMNAARNANEANRLVGELRDLEQDYAGTIVAVQAGAWLQQIQKRQR